MTISNIQKKILDETGLKTSVKKLMGSQKGYLRIFPIFQNGYYPSFPFDFVRKLKIELSAFDSDKNPVFCSISDILIWQIEDDRVEMKKERKPKPIDTDKVTKGWGSANSQMRLDKRAERYAKRLEKGNCAKYY